MEFTEQETQLIATLREAQGGAGEDFSLLIERRLGAWDIALSSVIVGNTLKAKTRKARGIGATFNVMIKRGGTRGDQSGAEDRVGHPQPVQRAFRAERISRRRRHDDQERDVGLGQGQKQRGTARFRRDRCRDFNRGSHYATCAEVVEFARVVLGRSIR